MGTPNWTRHCPVVFGPPTKMRAFVLFSLGLLLSSLLITPIEGAKGGAKSAMNRRGKSKDSGRRGQGAGREDDDEDIGGQGDKSVPYASRPCVGLCYILKMKSLKTKGIKPKQLEVENMRKRRPCIGLCHLNRVAKAKGLPGFLWKHPKQEAKDRKEEEREEKKERERLEKEKEKKAKEALEAGTDISAFKS